jgi:hypothetical protein
MACASGTGIHHDAGSGSGLRESAFTAFAGSSMLVMDFQTDAVLRVLKGSLEGTQSINVSSSFHLNSSPVLAYSVRP